MGGGSWTTSSFASYSTSVGRSYDVKTCSFDKSYSSQEMFKQSMLHEQLKPYNVLRECVDTEEHPNTIPVIFGLDVTGSMGDAAVKCATAIDKIMSELFGKYKDIEFCIMGIGDLACDDSPIQISQFESDVRIAEWMDKVYFEYGGGGNSYESYTAAWYMGSRHCGLDCWKRGKKGIIITLGDEQLNPYLPQHRLQEVTGDGIQAHIETKDLYEEASEKFEIFHIDVDHRWNHDTQIVPSWTKYLDNEHFKTVKLDNVTDTIVEMISSVLDKASETTGTTNVQLNENGEVVW